MPACRPNSSCCGGLVSPRAAKVIPPPGPFKNRAFLNWVFAFSAPQTSAKGGLFFFYELSLAKPELCTKRVDPETGRKFYDLNKDPIVSPYTGKSYPRSYFEEGKISAIEEDEEVAAKEIDAEEEEGAEIVALEDADEETKGGADDLPDL